MAVQKFKASNRRKLAAKRAAGARAASAFSAANLNTIRRQPLDVSGVVLLEHEINPDYWREPGR